MAGQWFSLVSSTNKIDGHNITEITTYPRRIILYIFMPCTVPSNDGCNEFSTNTCWIVPVGSCLKLCPVVMAAMNFRLIHFHVGSYLKLPCSDGCDEFSTNKKNINIVNDHTGNFFSNCCMVSEKCLKNRQWMPSDEWWLCLVLLFNQIFMSCSKAS